HHCSDQHRLASIAVGEQAPNGAQERERETRGTARGTRPEGQLVRIRDAQGLDVEREEGKGEGEAEDGGELSEPEHGQVPAPAGQRRGRRGRERLAGQPRVSNRRAGLIGSSRTTASGRSCRIASSTALAIAAGAGMVPLSPAPLKPSGLWGVGVPSETSS